MSAQTTGSPTLNTSEVSNGTIEYVIVDGVCYVHIDNMIFKNTGDSKTIATNMPKAALQGQSQFAGSNASNNAAIAAAGEGCWVGQNTTVLKAHINGRQALQHYCSFCYPVKPT